LFAERFSLWSDPLPHPSPDPYIPFLTVPGPSPQYGIIPDDDHTHDLLGALQRAALSGDITDSAIFFSSFNRYKNWVQANREGSPLCARVAELGECDKR
jgi:hypothetical protein